MIEINNVTYKYNGTAAVENVTLTVADGSVMGIVGKNGCGKTTLLNMCAGVYKPFAGEILLDGAPAYDNDRERKKLFYLADNFYLPSAFSVKRAAKFYAAHHPDFDYEIFEKICAAFELDETKNIKSLSKGMAKQAGIAIAFAAKPKYLLIDETFDGLDPQKKQLLRKLLLDYIAETDASVIISSHDLHEISTLCDRIALINETHAILDCAADDVSDSYRRVKITADSDITSEMFEGISYTDIKISGKAALLTVFGDTDREIAKLRALDVTVADCERLTLEEVFNAETEGKINGEKLENIFNKKDIE